MIYIFISLVAAATIAIINKLALVHGGDLTKILLLRFILVTLFLIIYMRVNTISWVVSKKQQYGLIGLGFAYANVAVLFFKAMQYISPSLGSLILYTYPIMVTIASAIFLKEIFTRAKFVALVLSITGCTLVIGTDFSQIDYRGIILAFLTAVSFSIYIVGNKKILSGVHPVVSLAYMSAFCVVFFSVNAAIDGSLNLSFTTIDLVTAILLAIIPTLIGILCLLKALELLGASKSAIISSFEPVVTLILAYLIIGDRITGVQLIGGALILSSVFLVQGKTGEEDVLEPLATPVVVKGKV